MKVKINQILMGLAVTSFFAGSVFAADAFNDTQKKQSNSFFPMREQTTKISGAKRSSQDDFGESSEQNPTTIA